MLTSITLGFAKSRESFETRKGEFVTVFASRQLLQRIYGFTI